MQSAADPSAEAQPPLVARWMDRTGIPIALGIMLVMDVLALGPGTTVTFSCDRPSALCLLDVKRPVNSYNWSFPLANLYDVPAVTRRRHKGSNITDVIVSLETKDHTLELPMECTDTERSAFSAAARTFLKSRDQGRLELTCAKAKGTSKEVATMLLVELAILLLVRLLTPSVRIWADRVRHKLVFDIRPFGPLFARRKEYDLYAVREAIVQRSIMFNGTSSVRLAMGAQTFALGAWASGTGSWRLADKINEVLASVR
jgi:hypothetical protein